MFGEKIFCTSVSVSRSVQAGGVEKYRHSYLRNAEFSVVLSFIRYSLYFARKARVPLFEMFTMAIEWKISERRETCLD